jgi:hypothetical protein
MKLFLAIVLLSFVSAQSQQNTNRRQTSNTDRNDNGNIDWAGAMKQVGELAFPLVNKTGQMAMQAGAAAAGAGGSAALNAALSASASRASIDTSCLNPQIQDPDAKLQQVGIPRSKISNTCVETVNNKGIFLSYLQKCLAIAVLDANTQASICVACIKDYEANKNCAVTLNGTSSLSSGSSCIACDLKTSTSPSSNSNQQKSGLALIALLAFYATKCFF